MIILYNIVCTVVFKCGILGLLHMLHVLSNNSKLFIITCS